jgi:hypothetical protein
MAIGFGDFNGEAKKSEVTYMKLQDGLNTFRILPNSFLPSYTYWVKGANGKDMPFECLQFQPNTERFDNSIPCPIKTLGLKDAEGKDLRPRWSYKCQVINKATGKVEVLQMKKGIIEDIKSVSAQLEVDPTDLETGIWFPVERKKTGPLPMNVDYSLHQLKCKPEALSDEEKAMVEEAKPIDQLFKRETYDEQMARLKRHLEGPQDENAEQNTDSEAVNELES